MGVINITPNSFSGLGETLSLIDLKQRLESFGQIEALDVGAESTAPMNASIPYEEEWRRLEPHLPFLKTLKIPLSVDTYHPETIKKISQMWVAEKLERPLIWNDVSGKFDEHVDEFLSLRGDFQYVYCHNLAPSRELAGRHMEYLSDRQGEAFLDELAAYFRPFRRPRVIFDPTLGFSKSYEQNWFILDRFSELQKRLGHEEWLLGFSRKSFLRKRLGMEKVTLDNREQLDAYHAEILNQLKGSVSGKVWVRTHRPELIDE